MTEKERQLLSDSGIPLLYLIGLVMVILKLTGVISWSWWLVTLPFWGLPAFLLGCLVVTCSFAITVMSIAFCLMLAVFLYEELTHTKSI
jgi:hypothetical protein